MRKRHGIYTMLYEQGPLFIEHGIDAVPFAHEKMDEWRNNFKGIRYIDENAGYNFGGAVDDVWQKPNGELIVVDVKSTSKNVFDIKYILRSRLHINYY